MLHHTHSHQTVISRRVANPPFLLGVRLSVQPVKACVPEELHAESMNRPRINPGFATMLLSLCGPCTPIEHSPRTVGPVQQADQEQGGTLRES